MCVDRDKELFIMDTIFHIPEMSQFLNPFQRDVNGQAKQHMPNPEKPSHVRLRMQETQPSTCARKFPQHLGGCDARFALAL